MRGIERARGGEKLDERLEARHLVVHPALEVLARELLEVEVEKSGVKGRRDGLVCEQGRASVTWRVRGRRRRQRTVRVVVLSEVGCVTTAVRASSVTRASRLSPSRVKREREGERTHGARGTARR